MNYRQDETDIGQSSFLSVKLWCSSASTLGFRMKKQKIGQRDDAPTLMMSVVQNSNDDSLASEASVL